MLKPANEVKVYIGGRLAEIVDAGAAPGLVAGATQVNARVPNYVNPGTETPVVVEAGGVRSPNFVTLAVF